MKKKIAITFCTLLIFALPCVRAQTPEENQEKYDLFRIRLKYEMMYYSGDASVKGSHLPMERRYTVNGQTIGYWADATWWQGHYVAVLATEYYLKQLNGESTVSTLNELRQAIHTYNRLDLEAEHCWGCDTFSKLNGFYIRDDVDYNLLPHFPNIQTISGDYSNCGRSGTSNTPSQDQAWSSYLGFALTLRLVDDTTLCNEVRDIVKRMVTGMQNTTAKGKKRWEIINPVNGDVAQIAGDIKWLKYAHARAGLLLCGEDMDFDRSESSYWKFIWNVVQNNVFLAKEGNFRWYGIMVLSTVINDPGRGSKYCYDWLIDKCQTLAQRRPDLQQPMLFPHLPLANVVLYGYRGDKAQPSDIYLDFLNTAPEYGACTYTLNDSIERTDAPWHTLSLFCPWHKSATGDFNMLDYMLLYNLYRIVYQERLPQYRNFWEI
jgi:hypothetical protein